MNTQPSNLMRAGAVMELTGWGAHYLSKLRKQGVIHTWQPSAKAWPWYFRDEISKLVEHRDQSEKTNP